MVATEKKKTSLARAVFSGSLGNMLEWFDYGLYGYFAAIISADFFVADDPIVGLLLSFLVFGTGFLVRPIGGILIGAYADQARKNQSIDVDDLMHGSMHHAHGMLANVFPGGYSGADPAHGAAPAAGLGDGRRIRLFADVHLGVRDAEQPGFPLRWQPFSVGCGLLLGSAAGLLVTTLLPEAALYDWGWRVPFLFGILIAFYGMHMRKNVPDSPEFLKAKAEVKEEDHTPVKELFLRYKKSIITVIGLLVGSSATYYILITYMPTYISQFMGTSFSSAFIVNTSVIAINLLLCPVVGMLIDKVGRRRCLIVGCLGFLILSYPVFYILIQQTNAVLMIGLLGILIVFQTILAVAIVVVSAEVFPTKLRNSGIGFSYNIAAAVFGGLAPLAATALIAATGDNLSITYLMIGSVLVTLLTSVFLLKGYYVKGKRVSD